MDTLRRFSAIQHAPVVSVTDEELELVRRGQAEAARGECVDMRQALQRLRTGG